MRSGPTDDREHGAIAVMTAVLAAFLLLVAALAVDLGNGWARTRQVQRQVDVAALSAGSLLPVRAEAGHGEADLRAAVAASMNRTANAVAGQPGPVTAAQLGDGVPGNGEVTFPRADGSEMRVVAPGARVDFAFAPVAVVFGGTGTDGVDVVAASTVAMRGGLPPLSKTLPLSLPTGCAYGLATVDTGSGGGNAGPAPSSAYVAAAYVPPAPYSGFTVAATSATSALQGTTFELSGRLSGLPPKTADDNSRNYGVQLELFFVREDAVVATTGAMTWNESDPFAFSVRLDAGTAPMSQAGTYELYGRWRETETNNGGKTTAVPVERTTPSSIPFTVTSTSSDDGGTTGDEEPTEEPPADEGPTEEPPADEEPTEEPTDDGSNPSDTEGEAASCSSSSKGNFGQLDIPRIEGGSHQDRLATNIAKGPDHSLAPWPQTPGPSSNTCAAQNGGGLIAGAQLDNDPTRAGNNCVAVDSGNDGPALTAGLFGSGGTAGRVTTTTSPTCSSRGTVTYPKAGSRNNDTLSCFLRGGATLQMLTIAGSGVSEAWLDPAVAESPRFVWLPQIYAGDRSGKGYQAIRSFVPGFITDESFVKNADPTLSTNTAATSANGIVTNGGGNVQSITVFTFNPLLLPIDVRSPDTTYNPGLRNQLRLTD